MSEETTLRRSPRQERSQRRVDAIFDAAADLLVEVGFEALSTSAIAARAGISVGSLYQFFPNKEAVMHALGLRYLDDLRQTSAGVFTRDAIYVPLPVMTARTVDWLVEFNQSHPCFNQLFSGVWVSPELQEAETALMTEMVGHIAVILRGQAPNHDPAHLERCAYVVMHIIKGLLPMIQTGDSDLNPEAVREFKRALLAYLTAVVNDEAEMK